MGVRYPTDFAEASAGHHNLGWWLRGRNEIFRTPSERGNLTQEETWVRLATAGSPITFLSSETLYGLPGDCWQRLLDLVPDTRIEVIVVLRRRSDLASSLWRQRTRTGSPPPFSEFLVSLLAGPNPYLDYESAVERIASRVGHDAMHLIVYDRLVAEGEELLDFLLRDVMGTEVTEGGLAAPPGDRANRSLGFVAAEALRLVQHRHGAAGTEVSPVELARRFESELEAGGKVSELVGAVDAASNTSRRPIARFDGLFREQDERLVEAFGDRFHNLGGREPLFETPSSGARPLPFFDLACAPEWPDVGRAVAAAHEALTGRWR